MAIKHYFCADTRDAAGKSRASLEQSKALLPWRTYAYRVAANVSTDYFHMSKVLAALCLDEFAAIMNKMYGAAEYLCIPSDVDNLERIAMLYNKEHHKVKDMFGMLDSMHVEWKDFLVKASWQASFKM